jgi:enamine deaminase RidA (YjgF/YER057c/UK114 family)
LRTGSRRLGRAARVRAKQAQAGGRKLAWTLIPVRALALEGMLVEIDVIAVVPQ